MLIERQKRMSRVRFKHPIRVVTLEGQPRVIRTLTANVSRQGLFLRMPEPLPMGTRVALSLEAGGRALALAQAEVVWGRAQPSQLPGRFPGCGVRFTEFMHPRAEELVQYLVHNLDRGKPLMLAPPERKWVRWLPRVGLGALVACAALAAFVLWTPSEPEPLDDEPSAVTLELGTISLSPPGERGDPPATAQAAEPGAAREPEAPTPSNLEPVSAEPAPEPEPVAKQEPVAAKSEPVVAKLEQPVVEEPEPVVAKPEPVIAKPESVAAKPEPVAAQPEPVAAKQEPAVAKPQPVAAKTEIVSAKPERAVTKSEPVVAKPSKRPASPSQQGTIPLPSGAAASLTWTLTGTELRLVPELAAGAQVTKAFLLTGPARAVFDVSGAAPSKSHQVAATPPYSTAVRLGKPGSGTRIVVDLDGAPKRSRQDGDALVLSF